MCLAKACLATLTVFGQDDPNIPFLFYLLSTKNYFQDGKSFLYQRLSVTKTIKSYRKFYFIYLSHISQELTYILFISGIVQLKSKIPAAIHI